MPSLSLILLSQVRTKAKLTIAESREVVHAVRSDAELVIAVPLDKPVCRDPDDDLILAAALTANADAIVTGDQDLLVLKEFQGIPILNPRECLIQLSQKE